MTRRTSKLREGTILFVALGLLGLGAFSFVRRIDATRPMPGIEWVQSSMGPVALVVHPESAVWNAGLREGDLLLRVNGRSVTNALEAAEIGWDGGEGPVHLEFRRGPTEHSIEVAVPRQTRDEPYAYLALVGVAFWVSGLFIALRWPRIRGGAVFTLLASSLFAQLTLSYTGRADTWDWIFYWLEIVAAALTPALLLHLGIAVAKRTLRHARFVLVGAYGVSLLLISSALWLSPAVLGGAYLFDDPLLALDARDRLEATALVVFLVLTAVVLAKSSQRSASIQHRTQVRWLLRGLAFGFGPFVLLYVVPWAVGAPGLPNWAQLVSVVPLLFVPAAFTAALARYRLYDLDLLLLRGFSEVTAVFCAFGVYAVAVLLLREWVAELLDFSRSTTRYIGLFCMALAYPKLRSLVRVGVERAFYRRRYSYRATLLDWARELTGDTDLASLLPRLKRRLSETLGISGVEVLVRTGERSFRHAPVGEDRLRMSLDDEPMQRLRSEPFVPLEPGTLDVLPWARYLFPMKVKDRVRAVLVVGERVQPEEPLNTEDRSLLATLAAHLATTIEAARLVDEVRRRVDEVERLQVRQEQILESSAVGLLMLDGEARIQAWNRALEEMYGLSRDETIGRRLEDVFPWHVVRRIETERKSRTLGGETRIFRLSMVNRRGARVVTNLSVSPVARGEATESGRVVTFDDVSEQVKLEEQVSRQERLASLGLLAAGVAHEINTPLTGISSYAQMLLEESRPGDPDRQILEKIEVQTRRAAKITTSLLNLARPEETALEPVDLGELVRDVIQLFEPQVRRRGVRLHVSLDDDLPSIAGQKSKLQQVLLNLLLNARDAVTRDGEIRIAGYRRNDRAVLEVRDNGEGIAQEDLPSIFDPFFTTKRQGSGTGLGLSIAYGIVHEHQGEIHVESRPGRFTLFRIELPVSRSARVTA